MEKNLVRSNLVIRPMFLEMPGIFVSICRTLVVVVVGKSTV